MVMMYVRFLLSLRNVEDLLFERGIDICHETVRLWCQGVPYSAPSGSRLPGSTKNSGSVQITYTHPLGEDRDIEANWATIYKGSIYSRVGLAGFGEVIPGYITHRASLTYHSKMFDIGIFADNIFDKYATTAISNDISSFNQVRSGVIERYYARGVLTPRRVGVDFRFHY